MNVVAILLTTILLTVSAGAARGVVHIRIWPATSFEPSTVLVQVDVEKNAQNRTLQVSADSGDFAWSSERQLEGQEGPRTSAFICRQLPAGDYQIEARVIGRDGHVIAVARNRISVLSRSGGY